LSKHCDFCGRFFVPDPRVGNRQRSCFRKECQEARKRSSKRAWRERETPRGYFVGRYPYVKEWRHKRRSKVIQGMETALKAREGDPLAAELDAAMKRIGEITMENELLREKARRAHPLAPRRSKR